MVRIGVFFAELTSVPLADGTLFWFRARNDLYDGLSLVDLVTMMPDTEEGPPSTSLFIQAMKSLLLARTLSYKTHLRTTA